MILATSLDQDLRQMAGNDTRPVVGVFEYHVTATLTFEDKTEPLQDTGRFTRRNLRQPCTLHLHLLETQKTHLGRDFRTDCVFRGIPITVPG